MVQCLRAESLRRFTAAAALFVLGPSSIIQRIRITSSGRQGGRWSGQTGVSINGVAVAVIVVLVIIIVAIGLMGGGGGRHGASCTVRSVCPPSVSVPLFLSIQPADAGFVLGKVPARFRRGSDGIVCCCTDEKGHAFISMLLWRSTGIIGTLSS